MINTKLDSWSWAGSFATTITLIASRKYGTLAIYFILLLVPFINILAYLGSFIWGGLQGKEWIASNIGLETEEQKQGAIIALENIGFLYMIFYALFFGFMLLMILILGIGSMSALSGISQMH